MLLRPTARRLLWVLILALVSPQLQAQAEPEGIPLPEAEALSALEDLTSRYLGENSTPGALVAVASEGEVIYSRSYGFADVELGVPVELDTVFEIGSISKQFIALVVVRLLEQGVLTLEDPIGSHCPELPGEWLGATVRQLLTHTSGIPDYEEIFGYDVYASRLTPDEVLEIAYSRPMDFPPGTGFRYSNTGYFLLSRLLERLESRSLGEILEAHIFEPLGMKDTGMADPERIIPRRASGYWVDKIGEVINRPAIQTSSTLGAGGLVSTAADLARWDHALSGNELLDETHRQLLWGPVRLSNGLPTLWPDGGRADYAFGWEVTPFRGVVMQNHSGQTAGFTAQFARFPESRLSIIVFGNLYDVGSWPLLRATAEVFVPNLGPLEERAP